MFKFDNFTESDKSYIKAFYGQDRECLKGGYIKLMCGSNSKGVFVPVHCFKRDDFRKYFENKHINEKNMMMSMCSFEKKHSATKEDIVNVFALCVDVDFNFSDSSDKSLEEPLNVWTKLCRDLVEKYCFFPNPTYIEYGHRLRMVYMLEEPVCLRIADKKQRRNVITWLERIEQAICDAINETDYHYHAEPQQLTKFVRVPESVNVTYSQTFNKETKEFEYHMERAHVIQVKELPNGTLWDIHELSDNVLPDKPDWYDNWKENKDKKKPKISIRKKQKNGLSLLMERRISLLKMLQKEGWNNGYRELMCFLHWDFCLAAGDSPEDAKEKTKVFNRGFAVPLVEKEMLSHSRPRKLYYYSNDKLCKILEVPENLKRKLYVYDKKSYDREYSKARRFYSRIRKMKKGITRKQIKESKMDRAAKLRELGASVRDIAASLKVCIRTVYKYLTAVSAPALG